MTDISTHREYLECLREKSKTKPSVDDDYNQFQEDLREGELKLQKLETIVDEHLVYLTKYSPFEPNLSFDIRNFILTFYRRLSNDKERGEQYFKTVHRFRSIDESTVLIEIVPINTILYRWKMTTDETEKVRNLMTHQSSLVLKWFLLARWKELGLPNSCKSLFRRQVEIQTITIVNEHLDYINRHSRFKTNVGNERYETFKSDMIDCYSDLSENKEQEQEYFQTVHRFRSIHETTILTEIVPINTMIYRWKTAPPKTEADFMKHELSCYLKLFLLARWKELDLLYPYPALEKRESDRNCVIS